MLVRPLLLKPYARSPRRYLTEKERGSVGSAVVAARPVRMLLPSVMRCASRRQAPPPPASSRPTPATRTSAAATAPTRQPAAVQRHHKPKMRRQRSPIRSGNRVVRQGGASRSLVPRRSTAGSEKATSSKAYRRRIAVYRKPRSGAQYGWRIRGANRTPRLAEGITASVGNSTGRKEYARLPP